MLYRTFLMFFITAFLAACSTTSGSKRDTASVEDRGSTASETTTTAKTYGTGEETTYGISELDDPNSPLSNRIIYFDYDSSEIKPQYRTVIETHAQYLVSHPDITLSLEGHADERGSREYNLALGERRAISVKEIMTVLGAAPSQIRTISYGEERPIDEGHDDTAWSQNRRVELVY